MRPTRISQFHLTLFLTSGLSKQFSLSVGERLLVHHGFLLLLVLVPNSLCSFLHSAATTPAQTAMLFGAWVMLSCIFSSVCYVVRKSFKYILPSEHGEGGGQLVGAGSLPLLCGFWGINLSLSGFRKCLCLLSHLAGLIHRILILPLATINVPVHKDTQLKTNSLDPLFPPRRSVIFLDAFAVYGGAGYRGHTVLSAHSEGRSFSSLLLELCLILTKAVDSITGCGFLGGWGCGI